LQLALCKEGQGGIFFPEKMGDQETNLVRAFEHMGLVMQLPIWLVCHQSLLSSNGECNAILKVKERSHEKKTSDNLYCSTKSINVGKVSKR
jgi:hypothetical protein